jgi:CheY-like chemotaxis protein
MIKSKKFINVAAISIEILNYTSIFDKSYELIVKINNKINELSSKHRLKINLLCNNYFIGLSNILQESKTKDVFYFAADLMSFFERYNIETKIAISVGIVYNIEQLFIGNCISIANDLMKECVPKNMLIDNTVLNYVDFNQFSIEKFYYNFYVYNLHKYKIISDIIITDVDVDVNVDINSNNKYSILILDDSNVINKIMTKKLINMDLLVTTVTSTNMFYEEFNKYYFDAVILDIYLDDNIESGFEIAKYIKNTNTKVFICGMTGQEYIFDTSDFNLFIEKPWTNEKYNLFINLINSFY